MEMVPVYTNKYSSTNMIEHEETKIIDLQSSHTNYEIKHMLYTVDNDITDEYIHVLTRIFN